MIDGLVYIVGIEEHSMDVFHYNPVSEAWSSMSPTLNDHYLGSSFVLGGSLYVAGGTRSDSSADSSVERYDVDASGGHAQKWTALIQRRHHRIHGASAP